MRHDSTSSQGLYSTSSLLCQPKSLMKFLCQCSCSASCKSLPPSLQRSWLVKGEVGIAYTIPESIHSTHVFTCYRPQCLQVAQHCTAAARDGQGPKGCRLNHLQHTFSETRLLSDLQGTRQSCNGFLRYSAYLSSPGSQPRVIRTSSSRSVHQAIAF